MAKVQQKKRDEQYENSEREESLFDPQPASWKKRSSRRNDLLFNIPRCRNEGGELLACRRKENQSGGEDDE